MRQRSDTEFDHTVPARDLDELTDSYNHIPEYDTCHCGLGYDECEVTDCGPGDDDPDEDNFMLCGDPECWCATGDSPEPDEPETFEEMFDLIFGEAHSLMVRKHKQYGPGNIGEFGEYGVLVRASDKVKRLKNLLENDVKPEDESLEDSWMDLLNYAAIGLAVHRGLWTPRDCPPLAEDVEGLS